jgi:ubiquinol-cytochrome c reductase cytochrome c1 subunit
VNGIDGMKRAAGALLLAVTLGAGAAWAADEGHAHIDRQKWSFAGLLGHYDQVQLQRGFKVYVEACQRCHGIRRIAFRNLTEPGGPQFSEGQIKSLAAEKYKVDAEPNEVGKVLPRPAILADNIPPPFKNEQEARSAQVGNALPPDLSLIVKARSVETDNPFYMVPFSMLRDIVSGYQEAGADYLYAYLTGFKTAPDGTKVPDGMSYNPVFPKPHLTAMPNPFAGGDGFIKYDDGTPGTIDNYARDVTAFLAWASDPHLEARKRLGLLVMGYLLITALLLYLAKRRIWSKAH